MEMIAMLDGLGMNPEYPIGDVNPATSARYSDNLNRDTNRPPPPAPPTGMRPYEPMTSYPLWAADGEVPEPPEGAAGSGSPGGLKGISTAGWIAIGALILLAIPLVQKFMARKSAPAGPVNGFGYPEPEMIEFPKKKRRRKRRK